MNAKATKIDRQENKLIDITGEERLSITFRIGKDDITRKINTCLLPLELVKTTLQEINTCLLPLELVKTKIQEINLIRHWGIEKYWQKDCLTQRHW